MYNDKSKPQLATNHQVVAVADMHVFEIALAKRRILYAIRFVTSAPHPMARLVILAAGNMNSWFGAVSADLDLLVCHSAKFSDIPYPT